MILTYGEYDSLVMGKARAEAEAFEEQKKAAAAIEKVKQSARNQILKDQEE